MRTFRHFDAHTIDEACQLLGKYQGRARLNAGGTDLLSVLKGDILPDYPEAIINSKTIPALDYIREDGDVLRIGALARLSDIAESSIIKTRYGVLAESALSVRPLDAAEEPRWGVGVNSRQAALRRRRG